MFFDSEYDGVSEKKKKSLYLAWNLIRKILKIIDFQKKLWCSNKSKKKKRKVLFQFHSNVTQIKIKH